MRPNHDSFKSISDFNSECSDRIALLILLGLGVEIAAVFVFDKPWPEAGWTIAANALIIVGVWGELWFLKRARAADDSRVAQAETALAEAMNRAAEAQHELVRFRTSRRSIMAGKEAEITERLKPHAGTRFESGLDMGGEIADFWWDLQPLLVSAGWVHVDWSASFVTQFIKQGRRPVSAPVAAADVEIHIHLTDRDALSAAGAALVAALNEIGIAARDVGFNSPTDTPNAIHIHIGAKA
jgi:hypothetical protein